MKPNPLNATIAAAPPLLRRRLQVLANDVARAIDAFGRSCEAADISPIVSLSHCGNVILTALAVLERDTREDYAALPSFRAEAFGQRAVGAALDVIGDDVIPQPIRRMN